AGARNACVLTLEVPVEDMAKLTTADDPSTLRQDQGRPEQGRGTTGSGSSSGATSRDDIPSGPASVGDQRPSIWSAIHPRLLELIHAHRSTLIFVNSRRLAERLRGARHERAGERRIPAARVES